MKVAAANGTRPEYEASIKLRPDWNGHPLHRRGYKLSEEKPGRLRLSTDASAVALGGELMQDLGQGLRPLALVSGHFSRRQVMLGACFRPWQMKVRAKQRSEWTSAQQQQCALEEKLNAICTVFNIWRQETCRLRNISVLISDHLTAIALHQMEKGMQAWRAAAAFAIKCRKFVALRDQRVKRAAVHRWSEGVDILQLTPSQWAILRRRLRHLAGQHKVVAAITWETLDAAGRVSPSRKLYLSQAATVEFHVQRLQREHPERQEIEVTTIPYNRPAKLAQLGVDIEEVLWTLKRTRLTGATRSDSLEPRRSSKPASTRNRYAALSTDDGEDSTIEVENEDSTPTPSPRHGAHARTQRHSQRRTARVRDLLEQARKREASKLERKQRKLAKRKQAKLKRRGGSSSDGDTSSSTSISSLTDNKGSPSETSPTTSHSSSDDSMTSSSSSTNSRKGGRQRKRQARARRQEQRLRALREADAAAHEHQLQAMRASMQLAAEEAAGLQKRLLTELRQEVQDAAAIAAVE